jgi:hypothetical protein
MNKQICALVINNIALCPIGISFHLFSVKPALLHHQVYKNHFALSLHLYGTKKKWVSEQILCQCSFVVVVMSLSFSLSLSELLHPTNPTHTIILH